jgi:NAD+ kinase
LEELAKILQKTDHQVSLTKMAQNCQLVIVLGGDGTLLWGARTGAYGKNPVLGVNLGSLGFLAGVSAKELYPTLEKILRGQYSVEKRIMLEAQVWRHEKNSKSSKMIWKQSALNDAVISKETLARMVQLRISLNGRMVTEYRADGIIIASPTGSTAHSLSAGGPIVHPAVDALIITPICPHTFSNRPLIIKGSDEMAVEVLTSHQNTYLTLDGQEGISLQPGDIVKLHRSSKSIYLINCPTRDYYQVLHTKLHWGQR